MRDNPTFVCDDRGENAWSIARSPRRRMRHVFHGTASAVAGLLLSIMSFGGVLEAMALGSWGLRVFLLGWLVPFGIIGFLLVWVGWRVVLRGWQWELLESDGQRLRVIHIDPFRRNVELDKSLSDLVPPVPRKARAPVSDDMSLILEFGPGTDASGDNMERCLTALTQQEHTEAVEFIAARVSRRK
jgi:hypothetical protein